MVTVKDSYQFFMTTIPIASPSRSNSVKSDPDKATTFLLRPRKSWSHGDEVPGLTVMRSQVSQ